MEVTRFEIEPPRSKGEIDAGLRRMADEITAYLEELPTAEFLAPQGEAWSPERHLRHLAKSVRAVAKGMRTPRLVLLGLFGRSHGGSRGFDEVVQQYQSALAAGAGAGRFTPSELVDDQVGEDWQALVIERWRVASADLADALAEWSERALDRYRLPHPVLGKMTVREILFFTLYHNAHHARRVVERRGARGQR